MIDITEEMVDAVALALMNHRRFEQGFPSLASVYDATLPVRFQTPARAALAAVAPLIAAQAAAAEREACALIAERRGKRGVVDLAEAIGGPGYGAGTRETAEYIARAIRARGEKP